MIISVASGKGGTGKTTVAAGLAYVIPDSVYIDCDVEEPNGHLLLKPEFYDEESVFKLLPSIENEKCTFCGRCVELCEFNALINLGFEIVLFDEMCHGCGVCEYLCPQKIISEKRKEIGKIRLGIASGKIIFADGVLNIGEVSASPLIKEVKKKTVAGRTNIIDSPPGTSCSMVESIKDSDYCILVTESTPFGLNDLILAVEVLKLIKIPFGVVINKYDPSFQEIENYLDENKIETLLKIPFDRKFAEAYSEGIIPIIKYAWLEQAFTALYKKITDLAENVNAR